MKRGDVIYQEKKTIKTAVIELETILPIDSIRLQPALPTGSILVESSLNTKDFYPLDYERMDHDEYTELKLHNQRAHILRLTADRTDDVEITVRVGSGYYAVRDEAFTSLFERKAGWVGSDGIYSINLTGPDVYDEDQPTTLFCFGDTFFGSVDGGSKKRLSPHLMVNNSFAVFKGKAPDPEHIEFIVKTDDKGHYDSLILPQTPLSHVGTLADYLTSADYEDQHPGWLSAYNPEAIELTFDLRDRYDIKEIHVYNYFLPDEPHTANRGLKVVSLQTSTDGKTWQAFQDGRWHVIERANALSDYTVIPFKVTARYVRLIGHPVVGEGNYGGAIPSETLFGLRKVRFITTTGQVLRNVQATANTEFHRAKASNWYWMQDGIKIKDAIYYLPLLVEPDETKPEGFKFHVSGVCMIKIPYRSGQLVWDQLEQLDTSLYYRKNGFDMPFGAAILDNTVESNPVSGDGYIYIYGYASKPNAPCRDLVVARVLPEKFEIIDQWRFYNGTEWTHEIADAAPLLSHVSCELSVSPILEGTDRGKYLAVFMYDVNSGYVAYSIGETPYGPFGPIHKVFYASEQDRDPRIYTYNAKAHPHLSAPNGLLVSYNVNTFSDLLNASDGTIYHPRFIRLVRIHEE